MSETHDDSVSIPKEGFYVTSEECVSCDPDEDADCYMGVYFKVAFMSPQRVDLLVWSGNGHQWEDVTVNMHPKFSSDQRKHRIRDVLAGLAKVRSYCGTAVKNLPAAAF